MKFPVKIKLNPYFLILGASYVVLLTIMVAATCYVLYLFNSINESKRLMDQYIDNIPLKQIKAEQANTIINYRPDDDSSKLQNVVSPFRIFAPEEEPPTKPSG